MAAARPRRKNNGSGQFNGSAPAPHTDIPTPSPTGNDLATSTGRDTLGRKPAFATCTRYTDTVIGGMRQPCGRPVTGGEDWCRTCPGYKQAKAPATSSRDVLAGTAVPGAVAVENVNRCTGDVTDSRTHETRQCKNAVLAPATSCHDHGGDLETSFYRTYAKAVAEAGRGELTVPNETERAANPDAARAAMERDLTALIAADPSAFLRMSAAMSSYSRDHSVGRFSPGNQLTVLGYAYHLEKNKDPHADSDTVLQRAFERMHQPMHTRAGWEKLGRAVHDDAAPVPVLFYAPNTTQSVEVDEETGEQVQVTTYRGARWGVRQQFWADDTSGEPLPEQPMDPLDRPLPAGHGDPGAYRDWLTAQASSAGVDVVVDDAAPASGAKAYYSPTERRIHLWSGHAGGDEATQAHVLAHELGHVLDPKLDTTSYGRSGCNERGRAEVFAESFAYLITARHGFDATVTSNGYAAGWAKQLGGLGSREATAVMRDALTVAHGLLYPAHENDASKD